MSIETSFELLTCIYNHDNLNKLSRGGFSLKINNKLVYLCYDQEKELIGRLKNTCYLINDYKNRYMILSQYYSDYLYYC